LIVRLAKFPFRQGAFLLNRLTNQNEYQTAPISPPPALTQPAHARVLWKGAQTMSCVLTVQTKKYGAIIAIDLLHEGRLIASLIKENTNLVDYSGKRIFQDIDTAIEFYLTQVDPDRNSWTLRIGSLTARTAFIVHHSTSSFPLR
jgi:hypothetical protein